MWTCKHCKKEFPFTRNTERANHSRWCDDNPKSKGYRESNRIQAKETKEKEFGKIKKFNVACDMCETAFVVEEREKLFPQKEKYYCSKSCANSVGGTARALKYYPDEVAHYAAVCRRHHKMECLVCGFDKIVDAHHVDGNNDNNDPKNLVPICSNHHRMFHSRFKNEIEPFIEEYLKTRWGIE